MASNLLEGKVFVKISELDPTVGFAAEDEFVLVQNGVTLKTTGLDITDSVISIGNLANKPYVDGAIIALIDGAPGILNTLNELATALNDDANFAGTITTIVNTKLASGDFGLRFWEELAQVNTYHIAEGSNLYWTQERFDTALAAKNTFHIAEGSNLYFTEQRVLDVLDSIPPPPLPNRLVNGEYQVVLGADGTVSLSSGSNIYDDGGALRFDANKNIQLSAYDSGAPATWTFGTDGALTLPAGGDIVDSAGNSVLGGSGGGPTDRLSISGEIEVVLQSNGYIRLVNGAQLYDYGSGTGNGYGITDAANSTYIGYDPGDTLGALHMDSYTGGNIRIRTTTLPNTYKDWLFSADGKLTLPAEPTSADHAATKGYVDSQTSAIESFSGSYNDLTDKPTAPTYTSVTATDLNVQNVTLTGGGPCTFTSGNDLNFVAAGAITFNGSEAITKTQLKSIAAASTNFADFQARIAAL